MPDIGLIPGSLPEVTIKTKTKHIELHKKSAFYRPVQMTTDLTMKEIRY